MEVRLLRLLALPAAAFALAASILTASACSSFGESTDSGDAAPATEAGPAEAGTGLEDGGPLPGCLPPVCESFEADTWRVLWPPSRPAGIRATAGPATTGVRALELELRGGDAPAYVERALGSVKKVTASMNMLVVQRGSGEVDFLEIVEGQANSDRGVHFVHSASGARFSAESSASPSKETTATVEQSFMSYTRVQIVLDLSLRRYELTVGTRSTTGAIDQTWQPKQLFVAVGAAFAQDVGDTQPWVVRFDDVTVVTE